MRKKVIAGNWKMFTTAATARQLAAAVAQGVGSEDRFTVVVFPPFPYLGPVAGAVRGSPVAVGGQNCYPEKEGAFTGEVSPAMLLDTGCRYVLAGHSERRHVLGETDALVNRKVKAGLAAGLRVVLCVGETLAEREAGLFREVLARQVGLGVEGLPGESLANLLLAYEPVWAIGTGHNATPAQAQEAHAFLRGRFRDLFGETAAASLPILYGGSVKPDNATALLGQADVDGVLVGGASLKADSFLAIARAAP
jgi:triosephosphate isomerase (TIM)